MVMSTRRSGPYQLVTYQSFPHPPPPSVINIHAAPLFWNWLIHRILLLTLFSIIPSTATCLPSTAQDTPRREGLEVR